MRTFLLIVGIALILMGFVAALETLMAIVRIAFDGRNAPTHFIVIDGIVFFVVLYAAGFATLYLRHRITKPNEGE